MSAAPDRAETIRAFKAAVNMTPAALRRWLEKPASGRVGAVKGGARKAEGAGGEAVGHRMGRRILEIKATKAADLTDADLRDMRKVTGYVKRHMAQRPEGDVADTKWRKSLMNWGHDPLT